MASHNSARFIRRALASIDAALHGRPYVLVIADDASTDETVQLAREFPMRARERLIVSLPKAPTIGESKNRAVQLAAPFLRQFPWVAFMDDDDEMLPSRFSLVLEQVEAEGQQAAVGDWTLLPPDVPSPSLMRGDWSLRTGMYSPGMTVVHRDLIPKDGHYFVATPRDIHEDMVTHRLMGLNGATWCYHGGSPIHVYHQRRDSFTGGPERSTRMGEATEAYLRANHPEAATSIRSFCTVVLGKESVAEAELMLRSLRISGNHQPVVILTDDDGERFLSVLGLPGLEFVRPASDFAAHFAQFSESGSVYNGSALKLGAFLGKMQVLKEAVGRHGSSLYLDADMIVLRTFMDVIKAPVGVAPELSRSCGDEPSGWIRNERYGYFTGGCMYLHRDGLHLADWWRAEFLRSWRDFGSVRKAHGCFTDQACLDLLPLFGDIHVFHPGHNVMYTRLHKADPECSTREEVLRDLKIHAGHDLFFRGWPMVTIHAHFRQPNWVTNASKLFRRVLGLSYLDRHREILSLIDRDQPPVYS